MNKRVTILGVGGLIAAGMAALLLLSPLGEEKSDGGASRSSVESAESRSPSGTAPLPMSETEPTPASSSAGVADLEAEAVEARAQLAEARESLRLAEQRLDDLEREVEAVEQFVENIEERGDDPARHAFEGMEQLNPIIERYEARLAAVLEAEQAVVAAEARVERVGAAGPADR